MCRTTISTTRLIPLAIVLTVAGAFAPPLSGSTTKVTRDGVICNGPKTSLETHRAEQQTALALVAEFGRPLVVASDIVPLQAESPGNAKGPGAVKIVELICEIYPVGQTTDALEAPEAGAGTVMHLQQGARVYVVGVVERGDWYQIDFISPSADKRTAYVPVAIMESSVNTGGGSGLIVDTQGHVVTNNHILNVGCHIAIEPVCAHVSVFDGQRTLAATIVARDATNDLALLKLPVATPHAAAFRSSADLRVGERMVITGYALFRRVSSSVDMLITNELLSSLKGPHGDDRMVQITAPARPWNSGGPLLDRAGDVVGIVSSTLVRAPGQDGASSRNVNLAITANVVEEFLAANHVAYAKSTAARELSAPDIGDKGRQFTVQVESGYRLAQPLHH